MTTLTDVRKGRLSAGQVEHYRREGCLIFSEPVFSPAKFGALKAHFEDMLARWLNDPRMHSPEHMDVPHFMDPTLFKWLFDPEVLDIVEPILGPDIALFSSHFLCKPAGTGKKVPWHEDSAYWRGRLDPMEVVTVWLAIDPSTPANGCMRVVPGTHRNGYSDYHVPDGADKMVFASEIKPGQFDETKAVDCVLQPNHCSLHDGKLIHGSAANTGGMRRCGYTMRFVSTRTKLVEHGRNEGFQMYLARGRDHAGNKYGDPTRPNQVWLDLHKDGWPAGH